MAPDPRLLRAQRFPVHAAVEAGDLPRLAALLAGDSRAQVNRRYETSGQAPLHLAASEGTVAAIELLVGAGARLEEPDCVRQTALHYSLASSRATEATEALLRAGAEVNPRRLRDGWTPLFLATVFGHTNQVRVLLAAGADVLLADNLGWTPEDWAARYRLKQVQRLLRAAPRTVTEQSGKKYQEVVPEERLEVPVELDEGMNNLLKKIEEKRRKKIENDARRRAERAAEEALGRKEEAERVEKEKRLEQRRVALEEEDENERRLEEAAAKVLERQKRLEEKVEEETTTVEDVKVPPVIAETLEVVRKQMETVMIDGEAEMSNKESVADLVATEYVKQMAGEAGEARPPGQVERQNPLGTRPGEAERPSTIPHTCEDRTEETQGITIETNVENKEIKTVEADVSKQNSGNSNETVKDMPDPEQPSDESLETAAAVRDGFFETHSVKQEKGAEHATLPLIDVIETKTSEESGLPSGPEITASSASQDVTQDEWNPARETQDHDFHAAKQTEATEPKSEGENTPQAVPASGSDAETVSDAGAESGEGMAADTSETHPQTPSAAPAVNITPSTLTNGHLAGASSGHSDGPEVEGKLSLAEQLASCGLPEAVDDPEFQNKLKVFSNYRSFGAMYSSKNNFKKAEWAFKNGIKQAVGGSSPRSKEQLRAVLGAELEFRLERARSLVRLGQTREARTECSLVLRIDSSNSEAPSLLSTLPV